MILFFSTSAPHYHTDIRPNDCYNACAHILAPTWALTHPPPVTLPLSTTHLGHFILSKPPCTTNGPSLAPSPSLFAPSFSLFLPVYCGMMDANGYLLNWISSQDGDKLGNAFFFPSLLLSSSYFEPCSVQRSVERTLMRRTAGLIQQLSAPNQPSVLHSKEMEDAQTSSLSLVQHLHVMQHLNCQTKMNHVGCLW